MGKRIFLISKFEGIKNDYNYFHFKGYYKGHKIKKILVKEGSFSKNEDYILAIDEIEIRNDCLYAKLVKAKLIFT